MEREIGVCGGLQRSLSHILLKLRLGETKTGTAQIEVGPPLMASGVWLMKAMGTARIFIAK